MRVNGKKEGVVRAEEGKKLGVEKKKKVGEEVEVRQERERKRKREVKGKGEEM